jgi:hypothetical protein
LALGPLRIKADGDNFFAATFGFNTKILRPGSEEPIQAGDSVLIVLLADTVDRDKITEYISNASTLLGPETLLDDPNLKQLNIFMFGLRINYDESVQRHGHDLLSRPTKRQATTTELGFSCCNGYNPLNTANLTVTEKEIQIDAVFSIVDYKGPTSVRTMYEPMKSMVWARLDNNELLQLDVLLGAVALVVRNGTVDSQDVVNYTDPQAPNYSVVPTYVNPITRVLKIHPGDLVLLFVPLTNYNNLETLKFVPELVQDIGGRWDLFIENFCKDQVAAAAFKIDYR